MGWLPMYCVQEDLPILFSFLGDDIAFIVSEGESRWRATYEVPEKPRSRLILWHVRSGPIPLLELGKDDTTVDNPFNGWVEKISGRDQRCPYFGPTFTGAFHLNLQPVGQEKDSICGLSSFEWIGNHYSTIGYAPSKVTELRWRRLRRQVSKVASKVPRGGSDESEPAEVWAFPNALAQLGKADVWPS